MIPLFSEAKAISRMAAIVLGVAALICVILFLRSCGAAPAERAAAAAKTEQARSKTLSEAARDATVITGNTMDDVAAIDRRTEANHDTILAGDGSDAVALRALCSRQVYRNSVKCRLYR